MSIISRHSTTSSATTPETPCGKILGQAVRDDGLAFRYGGEEFLLLIPGVDPERAATRAEQILEAIRTSRISHEGQELGPVTASMGLSILPDHGSAETLVRSADAALLRAKQQGRDRLVIATANRRETRAA